MDRPRPHPRPAPRRRVLRRAVAGVVAALALAPALATGAGDARLIVTFAPETRAASGAAALARAEARPEAMLPGLGARVVTVPAGRARAALARLRDDPAVASAEPDTSVRRHATIPGDPLWSHQWGARLVSAPAAWDGRGFGDPSVVIAVVDTGVDPTVADLAGAVLPGRDVIAQTLGAAPDPNGHGTSSAGVAAARTGDAHGIAGICAACRILPVRALGPDGTGWVSDIALGIVWAVDNGADVVNLSLGTPSDTSTLAQAVAYAAERDVVVVASAGNEGATAPAYPAAHPGALAVAATDRDDALYPWSNRGPWVHVAAPGCNPAPALDGGHSIFCGTSSAAPVVAGAAGLLRSAHPGASAAQVVAALRAGAVAAGEEVGSGRIDVAAALAELDAAMSPPDEQQQQQPPAEEQQGPSTQQPPPGVQPPPAPAPAADPTPAPPPPSDAPTAPVPAPAPPDPGPAPSAPPDPAPLAAPVPPPTASPAPRRAPAPRALRAPRVLGAPITGRVLRATRGRWDRPAAVRFIWQRCAPSGRCRAIPGARGARHRVMRADLGSRLRVRVLATHAGRSAAAHSPRTRVVLRARAVATTRRARG